MAFTFKVRKPITPMSIQSDGTYWYVACDDGKILKITISNNTTAILQSFIGRKINCLVSDATYLYCGMADGALEKVKISDGVVTNLEPKSKARYNLIAIHYTTTTLYLTTSDGRILSRATT